MLKAAETSPMASSLVLPVGIFVSSNSSSSCPADSVYSDSFLASLVACFLKSVFRVLDFEGKPDLDREQSCTWWVCRHGHWVYDCS